MNKNGWDEKKLFAQEGLIPPGPAFAYEKARKEVVDVVISGYLAENLWVEEDAAFVQKFIGYRCNLLGADHLMWAWDPRDVFATREKALAETKFTPVELPAKVYMKALGVDENGKRVEGGDDDDDHTDAWTIYDCELPACCGNLSDVRGRLVECMIDKGLERWKIDLVFDLLEESHPEYLKPPVDQEECPNLKQILDALARGRADEKVREDHEGGQAGAPRGR
jgi:hypothetical protein